MSDFLLFAIILLALALITLASSPTSANPTLEQIVKERDGLLEQLQTERAEWHERLVRLEAERDLLKSVVQQTHAHLDVYHVLPLWLADRIRAALKEERSGGGDV